MKKEMQIITILCVAAIAIFSFFFLNNTQTETFLLSDYNYYLNNFPYEKHVDQILNSDTAIAQAELIWIDIYGEDVLDKKPYTAYFDSINDAWLIKGTCPSNSFGGVPFAIIQSDGNVLAIWHDK